MLTRFGEPLPRTPTNYSRRGGSLNGSGQILIDEVRLCDFGKMRGGGGVRKRGFLNDALHVSHNLDHNNLNLNRYISVLKF